MNEIALDSVYEQQAVARHGLRQALYAHAGTYVLVNGGLLVVNLFTSPHYLWVVWSLFGWGIGLGSHAIGVVSGAAGRPGVCGASPVPTLPSKQAPWVHASSAHAGASWRRDRKAQSRMPRQRVRRLASSGRGRLTRTIGTQMHLSETARWRPLGQPIDSSRGGRTRAVAARRARPPRPAPRGEKRKPATLPAGALCPRVRCGSSAPGPRAPGGG